jgi:hypothetical protein
MGFRFAQILRWRTGASQTAGRDRHVDGDDMKLTKIAGICVGALALALPAGAAADSGKNDHGKTYNAKGVYAGDGVVTIQKGNGAVKKAGWKGQDITFDFSQAEIRTDDNNADEQETLEDVAVGSAVRVKARLPKGDPGAGPYVAQRLDDKSGDSDDDEADDDEGDEGDDDDEGDEGDDDDTEAS